MMFRWYRLGISPFLHALFKTIGGSPNAGCRFEPSCSRYAEDSIRAHGLFKGGIRALCRILRCHPFSSHGGFDPV